MSLSRAPNGLQKLISESLPGWFAGRARDLPWRRDRRPYAVWISEAMLQQTRVETVIPYFERWMRRFPDPAALAEAPVQEVLKVWEGLGYYARARNLHRAARVIMDRHEGRVPEDPEALAARPGIGPYTHAAVGSLAFGQKLAVLDGNVERVLARLLALDRPIQGQNLKNEVRAFSLRMMGDLPPGLYNEAMMELGATVCTPRSPACGVCPLRAACRGYRQGQPERYPVRRPKAPVPEIDVCAAVAWRDAETFLIARRHPEGLLGGMWEFPGGKREPVEADADCVRREMMEELGMKVEVCGFFVQVRHTFTHFRLRMRLYHCAVPPGTAPRCLDCAGFEWVRFADCAAYPFGKADRMVLAALEKDPRAPESVRRAFTRF